MFDSDELSIDCGTCLGAGTTACSDCIVTHLLANDDGPIDYVPVEFRAGAWGELREVPRLPTPDEVVVELLVRAGLVDTPPQFVSIEEFEAATFHPVNG